MQRQAPQANDLKNIYKTNCCFTLIEYLRRGQEQISKIKQALFVFCVQDFRREQRIQFSVDVRVLAVSQNILHQISAHTQ
jgi:hypothetical protein